MHNYNERAVMPKCFLNYEVRMYPEILNDENFYYLAPPHNILSIYDSNYYRTNDLDYLDNKQRAYLLKSLEAYNFSWKTGQKLVSPAQKEVFLFPKTTRFTHDLNLKEFEKERLDNETLILTPTQMASYIIQKSENKVEDLKGLIDLQPINIEKLRMFYEQSKIAEEFKELLPIIQAAQIETMKKQKIKTKKYI